MKNTRILIILIILFSFSVNTLFGEKTKGVAEKKGNKKSIKSIGAGCLPPSADRFLEFNNVRALIRNGGDMWWDGSSAKYFVPKDGDVSALFAGSIWVGGKDSNGQLRFAGHRFREDGVDFYPGPLVKDGPNQGNVTSEICTRYDRIYSINRSMVTRFIAYTESDDPASEFPDYTVPEVITNWPAHGPTEDAYDKYLAPFKDVDGDGVYNPGAGDYPYYVLNNDDYNCDLAPERNADSLNNSTMQLFGDATLWWVYNDRGGIHGETGGSPIGMEFRAQAFAFATNDELNDMTFYNYQIINRSSFVLRDAYFGVWTDADMGYPEDDYVGCHVKKGLGYLYNGNDVDNTEGSVPGYGENPPAIGIDFFEGPYQDANGKDDLSSYKPDGESLDCNNGYMDVDGDGVNDSLVEYNPDILFNGNVNGLNFGDGIADNERWGMRRFLYFENGSGDYHDPQIASEYYRYLMGVWKNGKRMTYGGTGHDDNPLAADFMFPGMTDSECWWGTGGDAPSEDMQNWTEKNEDNEPGDRRLVQSAGPFTLEPGNVNDITTGAVWARAYVGSAWASAEKVIKADEKAQTLFEQCFQMIDGPDAPELTIVEMDGKFIFHISNPLGSNNYMEQYEQKDPFLGNYEDDSYKFQGYQVYQVERANVSLSELRNPDISTLVFQCDLNDDVGNLVNWSFDKEINGYRPEVMVEAHNDGIKHTFEIKYDQFSDGEDKTLVNYREYHYVAIAYAHNEYAPYIQTDTTTYEGQKMPYLSSRKGPKGGEITIHTVVPHPNDMANGGTQINSDYGDSPAITKIEGDGNPGNYIKLDEGIEDSIIEYDITDNFNVPYKAGYGPLKIKIIDPFNVHPGDYYIGIQPDSVHPENYIQTPATNFIPQNYIGYGQILDGKWFLAQESNVGDELDTIAISSNYISERNEVLFDTLGISIEMELRKSPLHAVGTQFQHLKNLSRKNGYIGSSFSFAKPEHPWLSFIADQEGQTPLNWIRAGDKTDYTGVNAIYNDHAWPDPDQHYENVLFGQWAPYRLASTQRNGPAHIMPTQSSWPSNPQGVTIPSVNVVMTKDSSKWTRVPVLETSDNSLDEDGNPINPNSQGGVLKFSLRAAPSVDKLGNPTPAGVNTPSYNPSDPNFVSDSGWSWFPGYAIDVNSGVRLNMAFGESSWLIGYNGRDMLWNPVETVISDDDNVILGGKHFIYVFAAEKNHKMNLKMLPYSEDTAKGGVFQLRDSLDENFKDYFRFVQWTSIPTVREDYQFDTYEEFLNNDSISEARIELRVTKPYVKDVGDDTVPNPMNQNYPLYKFSLDELVPTTNDKAVADDALEKINVVPNPYYAGNDYEQGGLDFIVKFINLPETCSIKIFNMAGTLVRSFEKDNSATSLEWNLKNNYRVPIAGGMYLIHIDVPGVGVKTLKWFGVLRPDDMTSF